MAFIVYYVYYKPKITLPLQNERYEGNVTMYLPRLGLMSGPFTTARQTLEQWWTELITNETDEKKRADYENVRKLMMQSHPFAHKTEAGNKLYLFDKNPLDQTFMSMDPTETETRLIHHVQDAWSVGEYNGFEFIKVKLDDSSNNFSPKEMKWVDLQMRCLRVLEDAARNTAKIKELKNQLDYLEKQLECERKEKAQMRSRLDRAASALGQKPLTQPEEVKLKGVWRERLKQWFTWPQVLTAALAYFAAPHIIRLANLTLEEPELTYVVLLLTIMGFFIIPLGRRLLGRWL